MALNYRIKWLFAILMGSITGSLIGAITGVTMKPLFGQDLRLVLDKFYLVEVLFEIVAILTIGIALWFVLRPIDFDRWMLVNIGAVLIGINVFLTIIFTIIGDPKGIIPWLVTAGVVGFVSGVISGMSFSRLGLQHKQQ